MPIRHPYRPLTLPLLLAALTVALGLVYGLALPGYFLFDDQPNLEGLADIQDWLSALAFVTGGESGPLGRPLALATFVPQAHAWPNDPAPFIRVNIALHLAAVWAAFALASGLARLRLTPDADGRRQALWIGLAVAALWGASPFLATSQLIVVQRMTTLAGLWTLLGLAAVTWAHWLEPRRPTRALLLLILGLGLGTPLAALSKENGALLPLLALIIAGLWIPPERRLTGRWTRRILLLLAALPSLLLLGYLLYRLPAALTAGPGLRDFTPLERLQTQPAILFDYLRQLAWPQVAAVSPFMDHLPHARGWLEPPTALLALLGWCALLAAAWRARRRAPVALFGLSFFLAGHLLESSFIHLELYFAHRNYVPAFGLAFALVWALLRIPWPGRRTLGRAILIVYLGVTGLALAETTLTWSRPKVAGTQWIAHNPRSERAIQFMLRQYPAIGETALAQRALRAAADRNPRHVLLQLWLTQVCTEDAADYAAIRAVALERLQQARYLPVVASELAWAAPAPRSLACPFTNHQVFDEIAAALLENPRYRETDTSAAQLLFVRGIAAAAAGHRTQAIDWLRQSFARAAQLRPAAYLIRFLHESGQSAAAADFLEQALERAPDHPVQRAFWRRSLEQVHNHP